MGNARTKLTFIDSSSVYLKPLKNSSSALNRSSSSGRNATVDRDRDEYESAYTQNPNRQHALSFSGAPCSRPSSSANNPIANGGDNHVCPRT